MTVLLRLERVYKSYRRGADTISALEDVSMEVRAGELVSVWGGARSGRTTLLQVASGRLAPDRGTVYFAGSIPTHRGFVRATAFATRQSIVDYVALPLLANRVAVSAARERAHAALERVDAISCAGMRADELDSADLLRVGLAQALVTDPVLVLIDEPTTEVDVLDREPVMLLLRNVADTGVAVLTTTSEPTGASGADRVLLIADGQVRVDVAKAQGTLVPFTHSRSVR